MRKKAIRRTVEITVFLAIIVVLFVINEQITQNKKVSFKFMNDLNNFAYQIEDFQIEDDAIVLKGWFIRLKNVRKKIQSVDDDTKFSILLYYLSSNEEFLGTEMDGKGILLDIEYFNNPKVNSYFSCEYDYSNCGFVARISKDLIDFENGKYQVIFKPEELGVYGVASSNYIYDKKINYVSPKWSFIPEVQNTDLEKIVFNGNYLAFCENEKLWIYQYDWKLYYIVEENDSFNDYIPIQYQLDTTQFSRLPVDRTDREFYWDNLGFYFKNLEITDTFNCGKYRVAVVDIPKEYSVTTIFTGQVDNDIWLWQRRIRPRYVFD